MNNMNGIKTIIFVFYVLFILIAATYTYKKPSYNWDMLGYMAAIVSIDNNDCNYIHSTVYQNAAKQVPAEPYSLLIDTSHRFKKTVTYYPETFCKVLPFVFAKPLYIYTSYLFYCCGIPIVISTILPNTISYILICLLLYIWLSKYLQPLLNLLISVIMAISGPLIATAKLSTPDCMSALFILAGLYWLIEKRKPSYAFIFLLLSVLTRIDNIIFCISIIALLRFSKEISVKQFVSYLAIACCGYISIALLANSYGSGLFLSPVIICSQKSILENVNSHFSINDYILARHSAIMVSLLFHQLFIYLLFAVILFIGQKSKSIKNLGFEQLISIAIILTIIIRLILNPDLDDRFHIAYYFTFVILAVRHISILVQKQTVN
jgi:hypothetical protein